MGYAQSLKKRFPGITLEAEDLFLLEAFQVKYLPDRVLEKEFSILLHAYPMVHRFLVLKYPPIEDFINTILSAHKPAEKEDILEDSCQDLLWEIADFIVYTKYPEVYDEQAGLFWEISELNSVTSLQGKTIVDAGAGTGRLAFLAAPFAETVFAVEPVTSLRSFIREKATREKVKNLFVMDGFLDSIPLPDNSVDVLMTSNAIGWNLEDELEEIERVLKLDAHAIHLLRSDVLVENPFHDLLTSPTWKYDYSRSDDDGGLKFKYFKTVK
jgi:hypothetical protein